MVTLLVTRGYPGSGKTTLARKYVEENDGWARVNRDDIRFMMFGKYSDLTHTQEDLVTIAQRETVKGLLNYDLNVVVDDTNLGDRAMLLWKQLSYMLDCELDVVNVTTDEAECCRRDVKRMGAGERFVGIDVIHDFAQRYPMPWSSF